MASLLRVAANRLRSLYSSVPKKEVSSNGFPVTESAVISRGIVDASGNLVLAGDNGVGYVSGIGGAVTQITSITTGVTLNKVCGTITTVSSTLAAGVDTSFTLTNSKIAAADVVIASVKSYGGTADGIPVIAVQSTAAGSCVFNIRNTGAVTLDALIVINFAVFKGASA
jgi:hypothetical protein